MIPTQELKKLRSLATNAAYNLGNFASGLKEEVNYKSIKELYTHLSQYFDKRMQSDILFPVSSVIFNRALAGIGKKGLSRVEAIDLTSEVMEQINNFPHQSDEKRANDLRRYCDSLSGVLEKLI